MSTSVASRLDTVGLSFPIVDAETKGATVTVMGFGESNELTTYRRSLKCGGFLAWGIGGSAWVEASLPKRVGDHNVEGLTLPDALDVMRVMYDEACRFVQPGGTDRDLPDVEDLTNGQLDGETVGWRKPHDPADLVRLGINLPTLPEAPTRPHRFEDCKVKRLDLVRDFDGVSAIGPILDGLAMIRQRGRSKVRRFADAEANLAETLRVGPKSWSCTLYDKHAESGDAAALRRWAEARRDARREGRPEPAPPKLSTEPGRLRYELRARTKLLNGAMIRQAVGREIHRVNDLNEQALSTVSRTMYEHVGFDREVSGLGAVAAKINESLDLTPRERRELTSYLFGRAAGIQLAWSPNTERKYRDLAAGLGIVLGPKGVEDSFTASLDYEAGTERVVLAA